MPNTPPPPPHPTSPTRRSRPSLQPTILYRPAPSRTDSAPPCHPGDDGGCRDCDERPRDDAPGFWSFLRAVLEPVAMR